MRSSPARPRRGCAALVLIVAVGLGLALAAVRHQLGAAAGMTPAEARVVAVAQWALWLLGAYVVAVVAVASMLVVAGQSSNARALLRIVPQIARPGLAAVLGVALTTTPAVAASSPPVPAAAGPVVTADPFDWAAPADAVTRLEASATRVSAVAETSPARRAPPSGAASATVRVRVGDCLWSLAAHDLAVRHLGSRPGDVAAAWRRWYAANRATIGSDPGLLRPGEILRVPPFASVPNPSNHVAGSHS